MASRHGEKIADRPETTAEAGKKRLSFSIIHAPTRLTRNQLSLRSSHTLFVCLWQRRLSRPLSPPQPLCLNPPKGTDQRMRR